MSNSGEPAGRQVGVALFINNSWDNVIPETDQGSPFNLYFCFPTISQLTDDWTSSQE
jgi:hypothetical protein